jgi:signal transduction histidine kinase
VADDADRVVDLARARADAVLTQARETEDQKPAISTHSTNVAQERADADEVLEDERAEADDLLRREREDSARILSALLPLARRSTDWKLLTERASSDAALAYRDDFLGMVSHDLNNLLGGIVLSASVLARQATRSDQGPHVTQETTRILLYASRMKRLVGDLTDVTSLANGKLAVTIAPQEAHALTTEALASFRAVAAAKQISLGSYVPEGLLPVNCDRGRILQVLTNLMGNAVKFTPENGQVSAHAARDGGDVRFSVKDNGPGIEAHLLEAVFERFWQAGKDDRRGLGLGLYIAKSIVDAHGGRIWVESRFGAGSTFHFTIPSAA